MSIAPLPLYARRRPRGRHSLTRANAVTHRLPTVGAHAAGAAPTLGEVLARDAMALMVEISGRVGVAFAVLGLPLALIAVPMGWPA